MPYYIRKINNTYRVGYWGGVAKIRGVNDVVSPTPSPTITPSITPTSSITPTPTITSTPTITRTYTPTPSVTPSHTYYT